MQYAPSSFFFPNSDEARTGGAHVAGDNAGGWPAALGVLATSRRCDDGLCTHPSGIGLISSSVGELPSDTSWLCWLSICLVPCMLLICSIRIPSRSAFLGSRARWMSGFGKQRPG
jgi:hypothetical protein